MSVIIVQSLVSCQEGAFSKFHLFLYFIASFFQIFTSLVLFFPLFENVFTDFIIFYLSLCYFSYPSNNIKFVNVQINSN